VGSASYDELVTVATVGLSRRQLPLSASPDVDAGEAAAGDAADALLEAAARLTVARRAGTRPAAGITAPPPMPEDQAVELPARAGHLLRRVASDPELLADLLTVAAGAGYRAPAPLLPVLLDAATRTVALRPAVIATLGSRGRWLAAHRGDWRRVIDAGAIDAAEPASGQPAADDPRAWETGTRAERVSYLQALRDSDPLVAREVLASGWARESAEERAQLLAVLARGLSGDDEQFLESALDDRAAGVRAAARRLLAALPGSAFNERAALRAFQLLHLRSKGKRHWLEAALPSFAPGDLARDGIAAATPGSGIGAGAWLLTQLIAAVPLDEWTRRWGLGAAQVTSLPVEGDLQVEVVAGWRLATVRQHNATWAAALLSGTGPLLAPGRPQAAWPGNDQLAAVLDPAARAALAPGVISRIIKAADAIAGEKSGHNAAMTVVAELSEWPGPWPDAVADLVLRIVTSNITAQGAARTTRDLLAAAARNIPVTGPRDYAAEFTGLAQSPACAFPWLSVLRRAADTLTLRRAFHAALTAEH
jgi:hypothetical protein